MKHCGLGYGGRRLSFARTGGTVYPSVTFTLLLVLCPHWNLLWGEVVAAPHTVPTPRATPGTRPTVQTRNPPRSPERGCLRWQEPIKSRWGNFRGGQGPGIWKVGIPGRRSFGGWGRHSRAGGVQQSRSPGAAWGSGIKHMSHLSEATIGQGSPTAGPSGDFHS